LKLSIVIPAYNEEGLLGGCLGSVREAASACGVRPEVVVCDNDSTDSTGRIAREHGAKVVFEPVRLISRSRNAGASAATGDWLLFIDADSRLSPAVLSAMLEAARGGRCCGGGCLIAFDRYPAWGALLVHSWNLLSRTLQLAAGSFLFCRAEAFREVGGFPSDLAAGEELFLSRALRKWGKAHGLDFAILTGVRHVSSGRKFYLYDFQELLPVGWALARSPGKAMRDRGLHIQLYDGRR
jgi:glycosyltransferase involved in cell wall biosynthesis